MKTILCCCILFSLLFPLCACCQSRQNVRNLEEMERTAVMQGDTAQLFSLWSPAYTVNNPNNMVFTAAQLKAYIRSGGMAKTVFSKEIEKISIIENIAVVMGREVIPPKNKYDNEGKPLVRRYTNIWMKAAGGWQLVARQATNITGN